MIKEIEIEGLNGRMSPIQFIFNEDINLFTGKNGCGKTTILKLMWFIQSGRIENLLKEISFSHISCTFTYKERDTKIDINRTEKKKEEVFLLKVNNDTVQIPVNEIKKNVRDFYFSKNIELSRFFISQNLSGETSLFFPTFRRIEGGFGIEEFRGFGGSFLSELSEKLSDRNHRFVSSISTDDILDLVNGEYAKRSEVINSEQQQNYKKIEKILNGDTVDQDELRRYVKEGEKLRTEQLKPFDVLTELTKKFFLNKGIDMRILKLGDVNHAISSDKLSSGEKQMLSFLCYNTFSQNTSIYIDEPELSLHPDWQRMLIPAVLSSNNNNQFFIATHSPFIYTKYPDKEFCLDEDKGGNL